MGNKIRLFLGEISSFSFYLAIGALLLSACATPSSEQLTADESKAAIIESLQVRPSPEQTTVEIVNSRPAHYTAFRLIDPPRVILDIRGEPGSNLKQSTEVNDGNVEEIRVEKGNTQTMTTRLVVALERAVDYEVVAQKNVITLTLTPKEEPSGSNQTSESLISKGPRETENSETVGVSPAKQRIFFKPRPIALNQVLGVDFTMLEHGKSLLVVTTDKKVPYRLERKGPEMLLLTLEESTIPPLLMRRLDSRYFEGTVDRVKASLTDNTVSLAISLREMVPFHVKQTDTAVSIDFGSTSIKPREKRLAPLKVTEAQVVRVPEAPKNTTVQPAAPAMAPAVNTRLAPPGVQPPKRAYKGEPMYLDFVNAEVTNILRLINEVSEENIIWDPAIRGRKVSMVLKNVPWDQALDLILINNDLGKRYLAKNILWITTKDKMAKIEAEERKRKRDVKARLEAEKQRKLEEQERKKKLEPLVTAYLPLDFATTEEMKSHLEPLLTPDRGKMSEDARSNTIIIKDIASIVEEAKKIVKQFDTPVKQIMIEARIVDATNTFTRNLGVRWGNTTAGTAGFSGERRSNTGVSFGIPTDATGFSAGADTLVGGNFSTNGPDNWISNIGITFGYMTSSMLGAVTLDASLALAETDGLAKIISAPKVIASNGESATIARGTTFYLEAAENVEPKEVTALLSLEVTPTVSFNDFVTMEVAVKDETQTVRGKSGKDLSTKLMVKSGETIVIGGIYKEDSTDDESGVPFLRHIPLFGWLFKAQLTTLTKSELLIFMTPTVLPPPGQARKTL